MNNLKKLLAEGETIYQINMMNSFPIYFIGTKVDDIDRELDVSTMLEETLSSMIDFGMTDSKIYETLHAEKLDYVSDEETDYYIDKGYIIRDFLPVSIVDTNVSYVRPVTEYTLHYWNKIVCTHFEIPNDATDDEILELLHERFDINPDNYIVNDIRDDGTMIGVQEIENPNHLLIFIKNMSKKESVAA